MNFTTREHRLLHFSPSPEVQGSQPEEQEVQRQKEGVEGGPDALNTNNEVEQAVNNEVEQADEFTGNARIEAAESLEGNAAALRESGDTHTAEQLDKAARQIRDIDAKIQENEPDASPQANEQRAVTSEYVIRKTQNVESGKHSAEQPLTKEQAAQKFTEDFCTKFGIKEKKHIAAVNAMVQSPAFQEFSKGVVKKAFAEGVPTAEQLQEVFDQELKNAPPSVQKQVKELQGMIEKGLTKKSPDNKEFSTEGISEVIKEFMKYFKEFLQEIGLIQKDNETGKKDAKGDAKGLEASSKQYEEYNDSKEDMSAVDQKKSLEGLKKTVDAQVNDAEKGVDKAKKKVTKIVDRITETETALGKAREKGEEGESSEEITKLEKQLEGLKTEKETAEKEVKKREETLKGFKELQKQIESAMKEIPDVMTEAEKKERIADLTSQLDEAVKPDSNLDPFAIHAEIEALEGSSAA